MRCEKCMSFRITATASRRPLRGASEYLMECVNCNHKWSALKGRVPDLEKRIEVSKNWANVKFLPSTLQQLFDSNNKEGDKS